MSNIHPLNIYEEYDTETTVDLSSKELETFPDFINNTKLVTIIYLQSNLIKTLPDNFFLCFPNLVWLDLRDNKLEGIPLSIKNHSSLTHLLLQNNNLTTLPNELGSVLTLKVLQLSGNPLVYPPKYIINAGTSTILKFLYNNFVDNLVDANSLASEKTSEFEPGDELSNGARSYNSVLDRNEINKMNKLSVQFSERDVESQSYDRLKGKCPKLAISRQKTLTPHCQSSKYLQPIRTANKAAQDQKILQSYLKDLAIKKRKDFIVRADKIIQDKKNMELLRNWRKNYKNRQLFMSSDTTNYSNPQYPYDTNPDYMRFLTREDIERDLPDKYRKKITRRSKPTVPRKSNNDVHLAMKIKKLFENLEAIDLETNEMTPRTEQKILLHEIQKITEIKQKLTELSLTNCKSVIED